MIRIVRPDMRVLPGSVTPDPDDNFQAVWMIDGRPSYPYKKTGGISANVTPDVSRSYDVVAVTRHLVPAAGTVTVNGNVVTIPAYGADGIPKNASTVLGTPDTIAGTFTVLTAGEIIGDLWVGLSFTLPDFLYSRTLRPGELVQWEAALGPYIDGYAEILSITGRLTLTNAEFLQFQAWSESSRKGALPSLVIFDSLVVEAGTWLCLMSWTATHSENHHEVDLTLVQIPNTDW